MITTPHTYAEWATVLDQFQRKTDDEAVLRAMKSGTLNWQTGVAERFAQRLVDAVNARMDAASDKFQLDMRRSNGQESGLVRALLALRKEMAFLAQAIDLPVIPEKDRQQYVRLVRDQANRMQSSLEESARKERSGRLASTVRNHRVNSF